MELTALPLRPLWLGFAGDVGFYGILLAAVVRGSAALRSWRRARSGQCGYCGYDRRGLALEAACPECGRPGIQTNTSETVAQG